MDNHLIDLVVGMILPLPISFIKGLITKPSTDRWKIYALSLGLSVLVGLVTALLKGYRFDDPALLLSTIAIVIASAQTSYALIMKETGLDDTITDTAKKISE